MIDPDITFFQQHKDRQARIRFPEPYNEMHREFNSLGDHPAHRRRVLVWRVPEGNRWFDKLKQPLLKIPFLAFADETIEDTDEIVLPIIHQIMVEAQASGGGRV